MAKFSYEDEPEGEPVEGTPITILADAVNQLAMQVEHLAWITRATANGGPSFTKVMEATRKIRETLVELIPE